MMQVPKFIYILLPPPEKQRDIRDMGNTDTRGSSRKRRRRQAENVMASLPAVIKVIPFLNSAGGLCRLCHDHVQPKPIIPLALHAR